MYFVFLGKEEIGADVPIVPVVQVQDVSLRRGAHGQDVPSGCQKGLICPFWIRRDRWTQSHRPQPSQLDLDGCDLY